MSLLQVAQPLRGGQRRHHAVGEESTRGPGSAADFAAGGGHTGGTGPLATSSGEASTQGVTRHPEAWRARRGLRLTRSRSSRSGWA